jgi:hypothetical protein
VRRRKWADPFGRLDRKPGTLFTLCIYRYFETELCTNDDIQKNFLVFILQFSFEAQKMEEPHDLQIQLSQRQDILNSNISLTHKRMYRVQTVPFLRDIE